ncbi:MAG TPA: hypothetical protein DCM86_16490 [Verrucomicrobiales bacterium]|nr:hypothetical protein [Verrucomicrobiales bacterium]
MINKLLTSSVALASASLFVAGCAGPEQKLGRGIRNATEFAHLGEMQRSIEQTALWDGPQTAYSTGVVRGFNRSVARTAYGVWDIVTFPFPSYEPKFTPKGYIAPDYSIANTQYPYGGMKLPETPAFPSSNKARLPSDPIFESDNDLGISGSVIGSGFPGNRFHVFDGR